MDDDTRWQDAALPADSQLIGPTRPFSAADGYDDLETGIASIFAALHASEPSDEPLIEDAGEEEHTFQLLGELDRLWSRPSP